MQALQLANKKSVKVSGRGEHELLKFAAKQGLQRIGAGRSQLLADDSATTWSLLPATFSRAGLSVTNDPAGVAHRANHVHNFIGVERTYNE